MKKITILLLMILLPTFTVNAQISSVTDNIIKEPIIEELNLLVDGSGGVFVNITQDFSFILRLIAHLHFVVNSIDFDNFAGESTPLTNGFLIFYNNIEVGIGAIKTNGDLGDAGYDLSLTSDDKNPKGRILKTRLTFTKFNIDGLLINGQRNFGIKIQDNITDLTSVDEISVFVEGYKNVEQHKIVARQPNILDRFLDAIANDFSSIVGFVLIVSVLIFVWKYYKSNYS